MTTRPLCVYHANCADGFASAWAVHRKFGAAVDYVAAKYGDNPQLSEPCKHHSTTEPCTDCLGTGYEQGGGPFLGRDVLIVDFSYPRDVLEAIAREARSVLVLDHHKTAAEELAGIGVPNGNYDQFRNACEDARGTSGNFAAVFDMNRSGAGITWDYLHHGEPRPRLITLVEDRDLWRFNHDPETRQFHAVAASYGYGTDGDLKEAFARWDEWSRYA
jgi:oligoribonuclease NrnB/cAMP/cGMP phosphodiesterase (DHH superfamily)